MHISGPHTLGSQLSAGLTLLKANSQATFAGSVGTFRNTFADGASHFTLPPRFQGAQHPAHMARFTKEAGTYFDGRLATLTHTENPLQSARTAGILFQAGEKNENLLALAVEANLVSAKACFRLLDTGMKISGREYKRLIAANKEFITVGLKEGSKKANRTTLNQLLIVLGLLMTTPLILTDPTNTHPAHLPLTIIPALFLFTSGVSRSLKERNDLRDVLLHRADQVGSDVNVRQLQADLDQAREHLSLYNDAYSLRVKLTWLRSAAFARRLPQPLFPSFV